MDNSFSGIKENDDDDISSISSLGSFDDKKFKLRYFRWILESPERVSTLGRSIKSVKPKKEFVQQAPGKFVTLPSGCCVHYKLYGTFTPDHSVIVCLHGMSIGMDSWENVGSYLSSKGRQVLVFDLYGRGYSDSIDGIFDIGVYVDQLQFLLHELAAEINGYTIDLIGCSLGALIGAAYCVKYAEKVNRMVMISPSGFNYRETRMFRMFRSLFQWGPTEKLLHFFGISRKYLQIFTQKCHNKCDKSSIDSELKQIDRSIKNHPGYLHASLALSSVIYEPEQLNKLYKDLSYNPPLGGILVLWGTEDIFCSYSESQEFMELFADSATLIPVFGCFHGELLGCHDLGWQMTRKGLDFFFDLDGVRSKAINYYYNNNNSNSNNNDNNSNYNNNSHNNNDNNNSHNNNDNNCDSDNSCQFHGNEECEKNGNYNNNKIKKNYFYSNNNYNTNTNKNINNIMNYDSDLSSL